jgi:hypothetical protein
MSDLNLGPAPQSSSAKSIIIAVVVLAAVAVGVFYLNPRKTAELQVSNVQTYTYTSEPQQAKSGGNVMGGTESIEHDLYVVATLHIDNKLRLPLFINGIDVTYTAADGSDQTAHATNLSDLNRLVEIFPNLKPLLPHPINFSNEVSPKSVSKGQILVEFPGFTEDLWKQRKSASLTVNLAHQGTQTIAIPQ